MRPDLDCTPSMHRLAGCAVRLLRVGTVGAVVYVCVLVVATTVGAWLHRGPDPRLLRAACASKTASHQARSLVSMASIPRRSEVIPKVTASWEAEARAWADYGGGCE